MDEETANVYQWKPEDEDPFNEVFIDSLLLPSFPVNEDIVNVATSRWQFVLYARYYGVM
ncbi:MAG: hypothetical protein LAT67_10030 [Balneolales bacterium]|nr:hypothetical protein [Balneolales bacterium]